MAPPSPIGPAAVDPLLGHDDCACLPDDDYQPLATTAAPVCEAGPAAGEVGDAYLPPVDAAVAPWQATAASFPLLTMAVGVQAALRRSLLIPLVGEGPQTFILGRGNSDQHIRLVAGWDEHDARQISKDHAELRAEPDNYQLRDLGSTNGTTIYREDPLRGLCEEIPVYNDWVPLAEGDVIRFGAVHYQWLSEDGRPRLRPTSREEMQGDPSRSVRIITPAPAERPLLERLEEARRSGHMVELFIKDAKEKYVGRIVAIDTGQDGFVRLESEGVRTDFAFDRILTMRDRHSDHTDDYVHPQLASPQFRDRSLNVSGTRGDGMMVLVDFEDPRLTHFLDQLIRPIREQMGRGEITESEAAVAVWRVVRDYVPYDIPRVQPGGDIPNKLYRLGDFTQTGVCNERGMLVQVAMQYVGVHSRMEKGPFGGGRHAWVRATPRGPDGQSAATLILDPQRNSPLEVGVDPEVILYADDSTPFAHDRAMTVVVAAFNRDYTHEAEERLAAEGTPPQAVLAELRHLRAEVLASFAYEGPITWEQIEDIRRQQIHGALWMSEVPGAILYNQPYEQLSTEARHGELAVALALYEQLSAAERATLWREEGRASDGALPNSFLRQYREQRIELHEEGRHPFGQTDGLREALQAVQGRPPRAAATPLLLRGPTTIAAELRERYPVLQETRYDALVGVLSRQIFEEWDGPHHEPPPEELIEAHMERLFGRLEQNQRRGAVAAIRASDQGRRTERVVTASNIALELLDRYPQLEESAYRGIVDALSEEIFTAWEREGAAFTSERPGLVGLPPEEFIERGMDRLLGRLEQDRHRTVAAAIRASERGIRKDRDTRDLAGRIRAAAERAAEIGRER